MRLVGRITKFLTEDSGFTIKMSFKPCNETKLFDLAVIKGVLREFSGKTYPVAGLPTTIEIQLDEETLQTIIRNLV